MITGWSAERLIVQIGVDGADIAGESIGGAAREPAPVLGRARTHEAWRATGTGSRGPARTSQASTTGRRPPRPRRPPCQRPQTPTAAAQPSHAAGCAADVPRSDARRGGAPTDRHRCRGCRRLALLPNRAREPSPWRRPASGSASHRRERAPPRDGPTPGTSGRRGTHSRGSTPPGAPARVERGQARHSSDGGDPVGPPARPARPRTPRTGTPAKHRRWAAHARSSRR